MNDFRGPVPDPRHVRQAEIEAGAGIIPLEELQAERFRLVEMNSRVKALKDSDLWKTMRDVELAKAAKRFRETWTEDKPPSEALVKSSAEADPVFIAWVEQTVATFAAFETVERRINDITEMVNRGQGLLRYIASEPK